MFRRPGWVFLAIPAVALSLVGGTAAYATTHDSGAGWTATARHPTAGAPETRSLMPRGCRVAHVALHGSKPPTVTCLSQANSSRHLTHRLPAPGSKAPATGPVSCGSKGITMVIWADQVSEFCFSGTGYTGASIGDVDDILAGPTSWVRVYFDSVGSFLNIGPNWWDFGLDTVSNGQVVVGAFNVTQVCVGCGAHS
jgi:hypothetical protein